MRFPNFPFAWMRVLGLVVVAASLAMAGCGDDNITGAAPDADGLLLVEDPLDGVLNSTEGVTPAQAGPRIDRLADRLGLDDEQKAALAEAYAVFRDGIADLRDLVRSGELTPEEARAQAAVLREAFEAELQVILTPEQYDLLQEMRQNRDGMNRGRRSLGDRWSAWLAEIGADDAQTAAILEALQTLRADLRELHDQVKAGDLTRDEARDAAAALREAFDAFLQETLTPEQYAALQELRPDCRGKRN